MKKTLLALFFRVTFGIIYLESLLNDKTENIIFLNDSESIILDSDLELKHNFSLINENSEKINLEISNGSFFSEENIQIVFKNLIFFLKQNDHRIVFKFSNIKIFIIEVVNF